MRSGARRIGSAVVLFVIIAAGGDGLCPGAPAQAENGADEYIMREALVIGRVGRYGRRPIHTDAVEAQIVAGTWTAPETGDAVALPDGSTQAWAEAAAREDGWLKHNALRGRYACWTVDSPQRRVMILDAAGHRMVYVNGTPRGGDVYGNGWTSVPVRLRAGRNVLLFHCARGRLRAALREPKAEAYFELRYHSALYALVPQRVPEQHGCVF